MPYELLCCTAAEAEPRLRRALEGDRLLFVSSFDEAMASLRTHAFDAILIGMLFDESRALELMATVQADEALRAVPVVGVRGAKIARVLPPNIFDLPMRSLGAADVIDFGAIPDDPEGNAAIARRIYAAIAAGASRPPSAAR